MTIAAAGVGQDAVVVANVVVLGCGRSGTSIVGELFAAWRGVPSEVRRLAV